MNSDFTNPNDAYLHIPGKFFSKSICKVRDQLIGKNSTIIEIAYPRSVKIFIADALHKC